jgi:hypothetical protein
MYQIKITIDFITPSIWRTIQVPESFSRNQLYHFSQIAFGWLNYQLYLFGVWENKTGDPSLWDDGKKVWDKKVKIKNVLNNPNPKPTINNES